MADVILAGENHEPQFERINRFQTILPGEYVRAREEIAAELIPEDEILAINDVHFVDNVPHTIKVRAHPRHFGQQDKRPVKHRGWELTEHAFLLKDFLAYFEPATLEEAQARRNQEQLAAQAAISKMQSDMHETKSNPQKMMAIIAEGLAENRKARGEPEPTSLPAITDGMPPLTLGTALARGVDETSVMQLRQQATHQHEIVSIQARWLQKETTRIAAAIKALTPYYTEQGDVAMASAKDMQAYVQKIVDGIKSLDLYLGKDVYVYKVRSGKSAPVTEPLTIVQRKQVMVEELAVFSDVDKLTDHHRVPDFVEVLREEIGLVEQIFPTPRSIVCMASTRYDIQYEGASPLENALQNMSNHKVFLLVRDGENVYYIVSPVESHLGAARLFPTRNEVNEIFTGLDGSAITFESLLFTKALSIHERKALHYKRLLILLCGLDHREKLFGEFYPGDVGLSFVSMDFQKQHMHFIADDDEEGLIEGSEKRPKPVMAWLHRANRHLTSGSRVFGIWKDLIANEHATPGAARTQAEYMGKSDVEIAFSGEFGPCVEKPLHAGRDKARNVKIYPKRYRHSREVFDESLQVPYLTLDAVEPEQLHFYIHDRKSRIENLRYIRLFKRAYAWIVAERSQEQPVRDEMLKAMVSAGIVPDDRADETLKHAIRLWRSANRGKALPTLAEKGGADWNDILDVAYLIEHAASTQLSRVTDFAASLGYTPIRLCVTGKAKLVLYVEPKTEERDDRITPHVWLRRIVLRLGKRTVSEQSWSWERLPTFDASEHEVATLGDPSYWLSTLSDFSSLKAKQELISLCENGVNFLAQLATDQSVVKKFAEQYIETRNSTRSVHGAVPDIGFSVPIGLAVKDYGSRPQVSVLSIGCTKASTLIYNLLEEGPARDEFLRFEVKRYEYEGPQKSRLKRNMDRRGTGSILDMGLMSKKYTLANGSTYLGKHIGNYRWASGELSLDTALQKAIKHEGSTLKGLWLGGGRLPGDTAAGLDDLLGIAPNTEQLEPGALWAYIGNEHAEYQVFYAEVKGDSRITYLIQDYDAVLHASWMTAAEREVVLSKLLQDNPALVDGSEVESHPMSRSGDAKRLFMKR